MCCQGSLIASASIRRRCICWKQAPLGCSMLQFCDVCANRPARAKLAFEADDADDVGVMCNLLLLSPTRRLQQCPAHTSSRCLPHLSRLSTTMLQGLLFSTSSGLTWSASAWRLSPKLLARHGEGVSRGGFVPKACA